MISKFFVFSEIGFFPIFQIPVFLPIFVNRDFLVDFSKFADKTQVKRETPKVTVSISPLFRWTIVIVVIFIVILVMIVIYLIMNAETTDDSDVEATSLLHANHIHKYY